MDELLHPDGWYDGTCRFILRNWWIYIPFSLAGETISSVWGLVQLEDVQLWKLVVSNMFCKGETITGWGDQANHRPIRGFSMQVLCWISQPCWQQWIKQLILMVEMHLPQIPWVALRGMPMVILLLPQLSVSIFFLLQIGMLGVVQFVTMLWIPDPSVGRVGVWFWIVDPSNTRFIYRFILL